MEKGEHLEYAAQMEHPNATERVVTPAPQVSGDERGHTACRHDSGADHEPAL